MNKVLKKALYFTIPYIILMVIVHLFFTPLYMHIVEGWYPSHLNITFDYKEVTTHLMGYLNYFNNDLMVLGVFTEAEAHHMADVRNILTVFRSILLVSIVVTVFAYKKVSRKDLHDVIMKVYLVPTILILSLGAVMLVDFSAAFTVFHKLLFTGNWRFSSTSASIMMLPLQFWQDTAFYIVGLFLLSLSGLIYTEFRLYNKIKK